MLGSRGNQLYPLRAPTIVQIVDQTLIVLTKTLDEDVKTSLCFVEVLLGKEPAGSAKGNTPPIEVQNDDDNLAGFINGQIAYEIPGAEMFLDIDEKAEQIFYLTNRKFSYQEHPCVDPVEARFSSPPLVKMITVEQARFVNQIMSEAQGSTDVSHIQALQSVLQCQKSWEVTGD